MATITATIANTTQILTLVEMVEVVEVRLFEVIVACFLLALVVVLLEATALVDVVDATTVVVLPTQVKEKVSTP
jgi:hypothetical protein